jgi:hypothetical protein
MRNYQVGGMPAAPQRIVRSLRNWRSNNRSVAGEETEFLDHDYELFTTVKETDGAVSLLQPWIEIVTVRIYELFRKVQVYYFYYQS